VEVNFCSVKKVNFYRPDAVPVETKTASIEQLNAPETKHQTT